MKCIKIDFMLKFIVKLEWIKKFFMTMMMSQPIKKIREQLKKHTIDGYIIPRADQHLEEDVAVEAERLRWSTGFTGSAGNAIIMQEEASVFVDGRYIAQVKEEADGNEFDFYNSGDFSFMDWLDKFVKKGTKIGIDPWIFSQNHYQSIEAVVQKKGGQLIPTETNLIDAAWQQDISIDPVLYKHHSLTYAGVSSQAKIKNLVKRLEANGADAVILSQRESIAWLLNIRGRDLPNVPCISAFAVVFKEGKITLFLNLDLVDCAFKEGLDDVVTLKDYKSFINDPSEGLNNLKTIQLDGQRTSQKIWQSVQSKNITIIDKKDPCILPRACKNQTEIDQTKRAHIRDGVALTNYLYWLDCEVPTGKVDELNSEEKLLEFRSQQDLFQFPSFRTISAVGGHASMAHYHSSAKTNVPLTEDEIYLVDSGGQYLDGTTDVTRTVFFGSPSEEIKDRYTRVLKGHIALSQIIFPEGISGGHLDALARQYLWEIGLDYDHGTGHGVGTYLNVHEGPQRISSVNRVPLQKGMIVSNEPAYYFAGEYGIRIENLVFVTEKGNMKGSAKKQLGFETLTFAPISKKLIDPSLLDDKEKKWLNEYHLEVRKKIGPYLKNEALKTWFIEATDPLN